jgi:MFS family permease
MKYDHTTQHSSNPLFASSPTHVLHVLPYLPALLCSAPCSLSSAAPACAPCCPLPCPLYPLPSTLYPRPPTLYHLPPTPYPLPPTPTPHTTGDGFQALVGGIGALFNGFGRLFWGSVSDKIGFKTSFALLALLQTLGMLTYKLSSTSKVAFAVNTSLLFFTLAGNFALFPPAIQRIFGPNAGATIYGVIYSAFATASVGGGLLTKVLVQSLGWEKVFQTMAVMSLLATMLSTLLLPLASYPASVV